MIDIREIYNKHQSNQLPFENLSGHDIINSTKIKSKDIISVFKRDITNILVYFLLTVPAATLILTLKSINNQSILLGSSIILASIYIVIKEFQVLKNMQVAAKTEKLIENIKQTKKAINDWSEKSRYYILLPAIMILNALLLLANGLSKSQMPFSSFNLWYSIVFSSIFFLALNYWIKHKEKQYTAQLELLNDGFNFSQHSLNAQKKDSNLTFIIIAFLGIILLTIILFMVLS